MPPEAALRRASQEWLDSLAPLGADWHKRFLEAAPAIIVVFEVHKGPTRQILMYLAS